MDLDGTLRVLPLTPEVWPAFEDLLAEGGPCSRCWCMYWRTGPAYRRQSPSDNKSALHTVVREGPPPGLVALLEGKAVGWCQLTPRTALPWLNKTGKLRAVDEEPVLSVSCFYVRKSYRRRGITSTLIQAAIEAAGKSGARFLEAYPLDPERTSSTSFTGYLPTFRRAGFEVVARHFAAQPIVRRDLQNAGSGYYESTKSAKHEQQ